MKYLFEATYKDGSVYKQNKEDVSIIEPEKRSCFFDVKQEELITFSLIGNGHTYLVDLRDGHFEIDGVSFAMSNDDIPLKNFRVIFWRRHIHGFDLRTNQELSHDILFLLGWQANDSNGKNVQHIIEIK